MWPIALTTLLLLICQPTAGLYSDVIKSVRGSQNVERNLRRHAEAMVEERVERRQATPTTNVNATQWNEQTAAACNSTLMMLNGVASNPAGMAVCYNLPYLDNSTGVFQADLRLYMISDPTGDFVGIPAQNVTVGLQYFGASVQTIPPSELKARDLDLPSWSSLQRRTDVQKRAMTPSLVQSYAFIGQINKDLMMANINTTYLQGLLIPIVTLSAHASDGTIANTTLSSSEATFVNGIFADQANSTAVATASASASAAAASATPFVLPGTKILILPIGAIITGVWVILGVGTVTWGTMGRMKFRNHYRERVKRGEMRGSYGRR